tara:strand:- start:66 stop:662 length:597 start_codon:yes stop_codon:yes gene_type:complete
MKYFTYLILLIGLFSCLSIKQAFLKGENYVVYSIDHSVEPLIDSLQTKKHTVLLGAMELSLKEDGIELNKNKSGKLKSFMTLVSGKGNFVRINGFIGFSSTIGFETTIMNNLSESRFTVTSDQSEIYTLNRKDSVFTTGLRVPSKSSSLILTKKPTFKKGDIIKGIVELESEEFYILKRRKLKEYKAKIKAYFSITIN